MCERIDTKGCLLNEENPKDTSIDKATKEVTPTEACNEAGEDQTSEEYDLQVVFLYAN